MRNSAISAFLLIILAACAGTSVPVTPPDEAELPATTAARNSSQSRPISGVCETTFNPPPMPLPAVHRQTDTGSCQLAHLGQTDLIGVQDINLAAGTQSGERKFTAANGDILRAVHSGRSAQSGPGLVSFSATLTFVGGTGRFAHATGQARAEGTANIATRTASFTIMDGHITYDASDRTNR